MKHMAAFVFLLVLFMFPVTVGGYPLHSPASEVISEIRTYNWTSEKGWFEGHITKIIKEIYDDEGHLVSEELYFKDMILAETTTYTYKENMVKKTTRDQGDELIRNVLIENEGDMRTETALRSDGSLFYKTVSLLDRKGKIKEQSYFNGEEQLVYVKLFEYTGTGDIKKISLYNPDNSLAIVIDIIYEEYDDKGNWISRSEYYTYGDVWGRPRDSVRRDVKYGGEDE